MLTGEDGLDTLVAVLKGDFYAYRILLLSGGVFFAVFSALLSYTLISAAVEKKRREIGILKSLGAKDGDIYSIFLCMCLLIGAAVFVAALAATLGIVYGVFGGYCVSGVDLLCIGPLQILILLLLSAGLPVACGALAVRQMLRYSPTAITLSRKERKYASARRLVERTRRFVGENKSRFLDQGARNSARPWIRTPRTTFRAVPRPCRSISRGTRLPIFRL